MMATLVAHEFVCDLKHADHFESCFVFKNWSKVKSMWNMESLSSPQNQGRVFRTAYLIMYPVTLVLTASKSVQHPETPAESK